MIKAGGPSSLGVKEEARMKWEARASRSTKTTDAPAIRTW